MLAQKEAPEEDPAELHKLRRRWKRKRNFSAVGAKRLRVSGRSSRGRGNERGKMIGPRHGVGI